MGFANIKLNNKAERGFTIVELLIVVVVIAILAAITIVSYNGITGRANASASKSLAATWAKKVEMYQAEEGRYPLAKSDLSGNPAKSWFINDDSIIADATTLDSTNGTKKITVRSCKADAGAPVAGAVTQVVITYYDYEAGAIATRLVGAGTTAQLPANCALWT